MQLDTVGVCVCSEELQATGSGAPFCLEVVRDGLRVGILRGRTAIRSVGAVVTMVRRVLPKVALCGV